MGFLLTVLGILLFLFSLAGVALGLFMALDPRNRKPGFYFALWWTPAVATGGGILMRDPATFAISMFCFVVAGVAFALERRDARQRPARREKRPRPEGTGKRPLYEEKQQRRVSKETKRVILHGTRQLFESARRWLTEARSRK